MRNIKIKGDNMYEDGLLPLNEMFKEKINYLQNILKLTEKQQKTIKKKDMENLKKLINKKQKLIEFINDLDNKIAERYILIKNKQMDNESKDLSMDSSFNDIAEENNRLILRIIKKIEHLEKQNEEELILHIDTLKKKINSLKAEKTRNKAYEYDLPSSGGIFFDKKR